MATLFSDNFTGANADPIGGNYTTVPASWWDLRRVGNECSGKVDGPQSAGYRNDVTPSADQWAQLTVRGSAADVGPAVRCSTTVSSFYALAFGSTQFYIIEYVNSGTGATVAISTGANSCSAGDVLYLAVSGTTLSAKKNGVLISGLESVTDTSLSSGRLGIFIFPAGGLVDDFSGGDFSPEPPPNMGHRIYICD